MKFKVIIVAFLIGLIVSSGLLWIKVNSKSETDNLIMRGLEATIKQQQRQLETPSPTMPTPTQPDSGKTPISPIPSPSATVNQDTGTIELSDGSSTTKDVVIQVARNIWRTIDVNNLDEVKKLLDDFSNLSSEDKTKYGVWGEGTIEYKVQALLGQGIGLKDAQLSVDPNGDYWTENKPQEILQ